MKWMPLWVLPLLVLFSIGTVWLRLTIVRTTYSIGQTDREIRNQQLEKEQAELRAAALRSPRRLELLARTRFGLSQPVSDRIIHLPIALSADRLRASAAAPIRTGHGP